MSHAEGTDQHGSTTNPALLSALTTEHYTLQSARSSTVLEANGRSQLFLAALTGAVVALALVAELEGLGRTFTVFALSLLPAVLALGLTTYVRLADLAVQDGLYARAIGRIRAFYFTIDPAAVAYWLLPAGDDPHAVMHQAGQRHTRWHHMSHAATAVAALTSIVSGVLYALAAHVGRTAEPPLLGVGATVVAVGVFALLMIDQGRRWRRVEAAHPTLFQNDGTPVAQSTVDHQDVGPSAVAVPMTPGWSTR
jgi:hypothetical protein